METVLIEVGEANAPIVTGVFNKDAAEKEIVFTGHYDTVFAAGSAGERPFHIKDGKAYGPVVCDMKGGIAIAFFHRQSTAGIWFPKCTGTAVLCRR